MGRALLPLAALILLAGALYVVYSMGLSRGQKQGSAGALRSGQELSAVLRAARRAAAADPTMPSDAALRQQELALALDEYDLSRSQLE